MKSLIISALMLTCAIVGGKCHESHSNDSPIPKPSEVAPSSVSSGPKSNDEIRASIVRLRGFMGMCSGEQIVAPSGKKYIISAKHCGELRPNGVLMVQSESNKLYFRKIIGKDEKSDLLLVEAVDEIPASLNIAKEDAVHENVRSFTHGADMDTYETDGEIIQDRLIQMNIDSKNPWLQPDMIETVTTARITPGSSGGALVDAWGDLIGVASVSDGFFGYFVRLDDIHDFLKDK